MKILKLLLIGTLSACFTCPAMGGTLTRKQITEQDVAQAASQSGPRHVLKRKNITQQDVAKAESQLKKKNKTSHRRAYKGNKRWERKTARFECLSGEQISGTQLERIVAQTVAKKSTMKQETDFCKNHCRELRDDELYDAEIELQHLRDTTDPTATFKKYPWLLYEHSDACKYHKQQVPSDKGSQQNVQTPDEK